MKTAKRYKTIVAKLMLIMLCLCAAFSVINAQESEAEINARITALTAKINAAPKDDSLYDQRGMAYFALRKLDEAFTDANSAIGINPKNTNALFLRGQIKGLKKDYDGAIADYTATINIYPKPLIRAHIKRGEMYEMKGDKEKARADYARALEISPQNAPATEALARVGGAANTVKPTSSAVKTVEASQSSVDQSGKQTPDYGAAAAKLTARIAATPNDDNLYAQRGMAYLRLKKYDEALADGEKAVQLNPKSANAFILRGTAKTEKLDYDGAIADFTQSIKLAPNQGIAYIGRGTAYERKQDYDLAIADYTKAAEVDPKVAQMANNKRISADSEQRISKAFGSGKDPYSKAYKRFETENDALRDKIAEMLSKRVYNKGNTTTAQKIQELQELFPLYQKQRDVNVRALAELPKFNEPTWEQIHKKFFVDNIARIDEEVDAARRAIKKLELEIK